MKWDKRYPLIYYVGSIMVPYQEYYWYQGKSNNWIRWMSIEKIEYKNRELTLEHLIEGFESILKLNSIQFIAEFIHKQLKGE